MQVQMLYSRFLSVRIFGIVSFKDEENYYYYTLSQLMQLNLSFQHQTGFWKLARRGCSRILAWRPSRQVAPGARSPRHLRPAPPSRGHGAASPRTRRGFFSPARNRAVSGVEGLARFRLAHTAGDARAHGGGMRAHTAGGCARRTVRGALLVRAQYEEAEDGSPLDARARTRHVAPGGRSVADGGKRRTWFGRWRGRCR